MQVVALTAVDYFSNLKSLGSLPALVQGFNAMLYYESNFWKEFLPRKIGETAEFTHKLASSLPPMALSLALQFYLGVVLDPQQDYEFGTKEPVKT